MKAATAAFLTTVAEHPEYAQTLLVEIIGAGPAAARRRDQMIQQFADILDAENAEAARRGLIAGSPRRTTRLRPSGRSSSWCLARCGCASPST